MSSTSKTANKTVSQVAQAVGSYAEEAYHFVREGLEYAAGSIHGPMTPAQFVVSQYMAEESIDLADVFERFENGTLEAPVAAAVEQAGGFEMLNRNVSGQDLCWALRDFALKRWGMLADLVLRQWGVRNTDAFGHIVFALVENGFMQKESHDQPSDFASVYDFSTAFKMTDILSGQPDT